MGGAVRALPRGHCHHRATGGIEPERAAPGADGPVRAERAGRLLRAGRVVGSKPANTGYRWTAASRRCCLQCATPTPDTLVVADGFSCKTQIEDAGARRRALHPDRQNVFDLVGATGFEPVTPRLLEGHLKKLIEDHKVAFRKTATLSNLNDALKNAGVYDAPQWRQVQYLTDIRNYCGHKKEREPTVVEVEGLIEEVTKLVKTLF